MTSKTEGTVVLDGLVEGRVPNRPGFESTLRDWVSLTASVGLPLSLEIDGGTFNLLADNATLAAKSLGPAPSERIKEALTELLKAFSPEERPGIFSTLRSAEIRPGLEVQTVYVVTPKGTVDARQRTVDAETTPAPRPPTRSETVRTVLVGLGILLAVFGISSLFVDYGSLLRGLWENVSPLAADEVAVDASAFSPWFTVEGKSVADGSRTLVLTLRRTAAFPRTDADVEKALAGPEASLRTRLLLEALAQGYVRFEAYDKDGKFLGFVLERVRGLMDAETIEVRVPVGRDPRPRRLVVTS